MENVVSEGKKKRVLTAEQKQQQAEYKRQKRSQFTPEQRQQEATYHRQRRASFTPEQRTNEHTKRAMRKSNVESQPTDHVRPRRIPFQDISNRAVCASQNCPEGELHHQPNVDFENCSFWPNSHNSPVAGPSRLCSIRIPIHDHNSSYQPENDELDPSAADTPISCQPPIACPANLNSVLGINSANQSENDNVLPVPPVFMDASVESNDENFDPIGEPFLHKPRARNPLSRPQQHYAGSMGWSCNECGALHFRAEETTRRVYTKCCANGSVMLDPLNEYPVLLREWIAGNSDDAKKVKTNIRKYNSAVAFASFGYQPGKLGNSRGPPTVVIHGQVYHRASTTTNIPAQPSYSQLYFLDPDYATTTRMSNEHNKECSPQIMVKLDQLLREINPYAAAFKMMREKLISDQSADIKMWITRDRKSDPRRYNLPIANEVAAVFVSEDGEPPFDRDICFQRHDSPFLENLKIISRNCDPMIYPVLFPHADPGWQPGILRRKISSADDNNREDEVADIEGQPDGDDDNDEESGAVNRFDKNKIPKPRRVSMLDFYSFRLQERSGVFNPLLHAGKLSQQFIIDAFLKVEGERLEWNRRNQKTLRVELYLGLMDYVNSRAEQMQLRPGKMVILPSSFTCGKRFMQQQYQDAMAIVAKYGKPDLFITFTCNANWPEITENLNKEANETAIDRPDLVARVFNVKLKEFLKDVTGSIGIFGTTLAHLAVIEFQKRGLPHCHLLLILADQDKIREPEQVDETVSAELPDAEDPVFDIVKNCMMHGPCGDHNNKAPCMDEVKGVRQCTKRFPKDFVRKTEMDNDGYPLYRRRNDGRKIVVRGVEMDNRNVVPYNPFLLLKYNAHINVEICSTVKSVKYIFKYIYKGHDAAIIRVGDNGVGGDFDWDEIATYLDTRYIGSPEAMWRLLKHDMLYRSHTIERLPVHLPSQQTVIFQEGDEERQLRAAEKREPNLPNGFC